MGLSALPSGAPSPETYDSSVLLDGVLSAAALDNNPRQAGGAA
jgi:hypothetical protein